MVESHEKYTCDKCGKSEFVPTRRQASDLEKPANWWKFEAHPEFEPHRKSVVLIRYVCPGCFFLFWEEHFGPASKALTRLGERVA